MKNLFWAIFIAILIILTAGCSSTQLENGAIRAKFNSKGLVSIYDRELDKSIELSSDNWLFIIDDDSLASDDLEPADRTIEDGALSYHYKTGNYNIEVLYELKPGWRFVTKQLIIASDNEKLSVRKIDVLQGHMENQVKSVNVTGLSSNRRSSMALGDYGAFVRMDSAWGGMFLVQNPFFQWKFDNGEFSMAYIPAMEWRKEYGPFISDRAIIGTYKLTGYYHFGDYDKANRWPLVPSYGAEEKRIDIAEVEAFRECIRSFLLYKPEKSVRIHVPWCENDYQLDVATTEGTDQVKRIINSSSVLGIENMVYTPRNTEIAQAAEASDSWGWEHLLWLNMGVKIRKDEWDPKTDEIPGKTKEFIDYAGEKGIKLMAYVYPTLGFSQDSAWLEPRSGNSRQVVATFSSREFQDWFIENLLEFKKRTGISGYAFDYWFMRVGTLSPYSQWYGGRRVLEELRKQAPDIVIDGRQSYHYYGPWTWLAGTYPHPTGGDEQPESFDAFPDLHFDRTSANHQRNASYWYHNVQFCPTEIMPGFITHQTARSDANNNEPREQELFKRDWDYLGWKYSLFSSIATAPFAHCVDMIPARDMREYELFMEDRETHRFIRDWFDWTDKNAAILRNIRSIIGPPQIGRVDGTAAIDGDHGFIFLFNPNQRKVRGEFILDESIGLKEGERFILKQLYPLNDTYISSDERVIFNHGEKVSIIMDGTTAMVLELVPSAGTSQPLLYGAPGKVTVSGSKLEIEGVAGEPGTEKSLYVLVDEATTIDAVEINGQDMKFTRVKDLLTVRCRFSGDYFSRNHEITRYDPAGTEKIVKASLTIPERIFTQLAKRKKEWNIEWTREDLNCTWLAPERLLMYIQIAEADWRMNVSMKINGKSVEVKKAYSSRYPARLRVGQGGNTFTGFYYDASGLKPGVAYQVEVQLPDSLKPGQFQGIFLENVETEYTDQVVTGN